MTEPVREFFSMGDVCSLTDLKPHVLRYWESQFRFLHPAKNRSGNRAYQLIGYGADGNTIIYDSSDPAPPFLALRSTWLSVDAAP